VKLVVGLGNPGPRYRDTRHNVGFRVVEELAGRHRLALDESRFEGRYGVGAVAGADVALLLPQTFMNRSGDAVSLACEALPLSVPGDLIVVYDDLDLPLARLRLRLAGGAGGHRGMQHIIGELGSRDFPRVRFGIGRPEVGRDPVEYVLAPFSPAEASGLRAGVLRAVEALECALRDGIRTAMDRFNPAPVEPDPLE